MISTTSVLGLVMHLRTAQLDAAGYSVTVGEGQHTATLGIKEFGAAACN